ncbi:hypothetical protein GCM10011531_00290 [Aquaticitalea lipolytica]|uniref:histidine kinase n=1 Tax=Aquaticitalea lipolytica TaxID=1247562 RepID=A0A8J2TN59_9FLAO|nr:PAS domain-containing sensor histidine kinase [Aquaticitalea lipolytica]GFZ75824.1 hypothetical protein GCM10011531_00290 [Aquaticitalea lipolytica]
MPNYILPKVKLPFKSESNYFDELKWKFALENSKIGIWDFNATTNKVYYSQESKNIIGFNNEDFGSDPNDWNNRVHPDDKKKYFQDFKDHLNGINEIYVNEHRILCKDGTYKWILDKGKIIEFNPNGTPKRIIGTHTDITNLKLTESQLNIHITETKLQNEKLHSFSHMVSHNLKSHAANLESILSFYDEASKEDEKIEMINYIHEISKSLNETISNLNELVSIKNKKEISTNWVDLHKNTNEIIRLLSFDIKLNSAQIINTIEHNISIQFNSAYFESIMLNLLTNSLKYKQPNKLPIINIHSANHKDYVEIIISDNGLGIDLEKFGKDVFSLYKTFHNNIDSEGVGLYLVKSQIESLNGYVTIKSKVGEGTKFSLFFAKEKAS